MAVTSVDPLVREPAEGRLALLVEDPDLALGVPSREREVAERVLLTPLVAAGAGPLTLDDRDWGSSLGIMVLDGFVASTTTFAGQSTDQLVGPGYVVQSGPEAGALLPVVRTHEALTPVRLAVLDRRFIAGVRRWPGVLVALHDRLCEQQRQLAVHAAIGRLRRNEDRVLAVLWQIAEQWGHVTGEGVTIPLRLTHAAVGRLAGASRPTISLALAALEHEGRLRRGAGARIVLDPDSSFILRRATDPSLRALRPVTAAAAARERRDRTALMERLRVLNDGFDERVRGVDTILSACEVAAAASAETVGRVRAARETRVTSGWISAR